MLEQVYVLFVAGGMNRRPGAPPFIREALAERALQLGQPQRPARPHVWVTLAGGIQAPGLVLAWRREGAGWSARTLYVLPDTDEIADAWLVAEVLRPVTA